MLPISLKNPLKEHLEKVKLIHDKDLTKGFGEVYLPNALERKYPNANIQWIWQLSYPQTHLHFSFGYERRTDNHCQRDRRTFQHQYYIKICTLGTEPHTRDDLQTTILILSRIGHLSIIGLNIGFTIIAVNPYIPVPKGGLEPPPGINRTGF